MTVNEILADLRDIHLPASEITTLGAKGFNYWPLVIAIAILGGILLLRRWRAGAWKRRLLQELNSFISSPETLGISGLLVLRGEVAAHGLTVPSLPAAFFGPPDVLDSAALSEAGQALKDLLRP